MTTLTQGISAHIAADWLRTAHQTLGLYPIQRTAEMALAADSLIKNLADSY